jgi:hypothetical protein
MNHSNANGSVIGKTLSVAGENTTFTAEVSDLTGPSSNLITEADENFIAEANESSSTSVNCGSRKKGSTHAAKTVVSKR